MRLGSLLENNRPTYIVRAQRRQKVNGEARAGCRLGVVAVEAVGEA